jgi:hypothetical protein
MDRGIRRIALGGLMVVTAIACGDDRGPGVSIGPSAISVTQTAVLVGAGDIGDCRQTGSALTSNLLDAEAGIVISLGDHAYPHGRAQDFSACYEPFWGRHRGRTRPVAGNHDYEAAGAGGYFSYFGPAAGAPGAAYYSFSAGPWLILALDSNAPIGPGSAQLEWARAQLERRGSRCAAALVHHPRFSSGINGDNPFLQDMWQVLYDAGVEVVVSGHDHVYERFGEQDPIGRPDAGRGIRQFIVGTGGAALYPFRAARPNSEVRGGGFGVLKLTLRESDYEWAFIPAEGNSFRDAGVGVCH